MGEVINMNVFSINCFVCRGVQNSISGLCPECYVEKDKLEREIASHREKFATKSRTLGEAANYLKYYEDLRFLEKKLSQYTRPANSPSL